MLKRVVILTAIVSLGLLAPANPVAQEAREGVLIRVKKPYAAVVAAIEARGGRVSHQYKYIDAIAAEVPRRALPAIHALVGTGAVTKDQQISLAPPPDVGALRGSLVAAGETQDAGSASPGELSAEALRKLAARDPLMSLNDGRTNVAPLHAAGYLGQGIIVAVVDSGLWMLDPPHLPGAIIGCENFVPDDLPCAAPGNSEHGTMIAGMVGARVNVQFDSASRFRDAILAECPLCFLDAPANTIVPMIGTAPLSSIYMFKVLGAAGHSVGSSVLAGLDRVIELRQQYEAGNPAGRNIQVVNLSLGGTTIVAGRDLQDQMITALIDNDIVPVVGPGNAGPSSMTTGSPASAHAAIAVGAASVARNERILRRVEYGPETGAVFRQFGGTLTAFFSSRGPNADGRPDPDVVANGVGSFSSVHRSVLASGTSLATPTVAGVAALLRQRFPSATARQIRNAIIAAANPALVDEGSTELDRGAGYVDAAAAAALLAAGTVPDQLPPLGTPSKSVKVNVEQNTSLKVRDGLVSETTGTLRPGQRFEIVYRVEPNTAQVAVALGVTAALPPEQQNPLFGDDVLIAIHEAQTSHIRPDGAYPVFKFVPAGETFVINDPQPGLMRVTISGDWTNAGNVAASVSIFSLTDSTPGVTAGGLVLNGQDIFIPFNVPPGTKLAELRLEWREDWGRYPTSDLDLVVFGPGNFVNAKGATFKSPELARIANPPAGAWLALVQGFEIPGAEDKFKLRITLDGRVLK